MPNEKSLVVHPHELDGFVRTHTFSDGTVISICKFPGCSYGIGRDPQLLRPSGLPLYTSRHIKLCDLPLETEEQDEQPDDSSLELLPGAVSAPGLPEAIEQEVEDEETGQVSNILIDPEEESDEESDVDEDGEVDAA